jgi:hypothetical protein
LRFGYTYLNDDQMTDQASLAYGRKSERTS